MYDTSRFYENKVLSRGDELRVELDRLEKEIGNLGLKLSNQPLTILDSMDKAQAIMDELTQEGQGLQAENAQFELVSNTLKKNAGLFLRSIGGSAVLANARSNRQPKPGAWWWFIDQVYAAQNRASVIKLARTLVILAVVLGIVVVIYNRFFAPDPKLLAKMDREQSANSLYGKGDLAGAVNELDQAIALDPTDPEPLLIKGIVLQKMGKPEDSQKIFDQAKALIKDQEKFLEYRAQIYFQMGLGDEALADANQAIALNADSYMGYFIKGQVYEDQGKLNDALDAYQTASNLATTQNQVETIPVIRMRIAMLLQRLQMPQMPTETPTP